MRGNSGHSPPGIGPSYIKITEIELKVRNVRKIKIVNISNKPIIEF